MKKKFTLSLILLLSVARAAFAAGPTLPASNVQFPAANIDGNRLTIQFSKGNGNFRIVVMKEGSPVTTAPLNGTDYTANGAFGNPAAVFNTNDGYVVYEGSSTPTTVNVLVTNLNHSTRYYVSVFEFNGSGVATEYLNVPASGDQMTKSPPTQQTVISSITLVAGNRLTVNMSGGNGDRKLLVGRKGGPVNTDPQMLREYNGSSQFSSGNIIGTDNFVLYKGTGNSIAITNLEPNTTYHFAVYSYNGEQGPVYLFPGSTASQLTTSGPTQASGNIGFSSIEGNRLTLSFAPGNGKHQMIIGRKGQPVTAMPVNGATYQPSTAFGSGDAIEAGQFVLNTTASNRTFINLDPASRYYFRVYDYDVDAAGNTYYLTSASSQDDTSTVSAPTQQVSNVHFEEITGSSAKIAYDGGNGSYRLVVMKLGSPVDANPADLTRYSGNTIFPSNTQITPGNYVMIGGQNTTGLTITGLTPGNTYHVAIWEFNGNNYPIYARPPATGSVTIPNEPSAPGTGFQAHTLEGNSFNLQWSGGNGARRIVIGRKGAAVTAVPADGTTYDADPSFGDGDAVEAGQFVVYDGTSRVAPVQNLEIGSIYHFAIFEYNLSGTSPDYLVSAKLTGTGTTLSAPGSQTQITSVSNIQNTSATINFTAGTGTSRLFIMRAGSPVNAEPQNLASYNFSSTYGNIQIGTGNYIVQRAANSIPFAVSSLTPNTHYYISVFEFNGSTGPVYLKPASTYEFTTTSAPIPAPTTNASNPSFDEIDGNRFAFAWSNGNGDKRIVVARQGAPVSFTPSDGVDYQHNASFGASPDLGNGQFVVADGIQDDVTITSLLPSTTYYFAIFEYNGSGTAIKYLTTGALTASRSTAVTPAAGSTGLSGGANNLTITITWNSGPGDRRLVVMKEGNAVNGLPVDLNKYTPATEFGDGTQIAAGEHSVYAGTGNTVTVTGLEMNKTYHYAVFEYNGSEAPVYNTANKISGSTLISAPLPLLWLYTRVNEQNNGDIKIEWGTTQEYNTSHFIVERSQSNGIFTAIGNITAQGGDIRNDYSFTDHPQAGGTISYRIKQVDIDGRYEYSKQVMVRMISQGTLKLYPNPAPGYTRISLPQGIQQTTVKIYDQKGALMKTVSVSNGELIQLQGLPKGLYHVTINDGSNQYNEKLIVQ